jgi:hypothetical protein
MAGAMEEGGKIVGAAIGVFKHEPLVLSLMIMNLSLIGFAFYQASAFTTQRRENVALFIQVQTDVQRLLSQCIIPPPQQRGDLRLDLPVPLPVPRPSEP